MTAKAKSETQLYRLVQLLSNPPNTVVSKATVVQELGVKESSVPVYIHSLKKKFGAEIEYVTEGRVITGYLLKNSLKVPQFKRTTAPSKAREAAKVDDDEGLSASPILDRDVDTELSDTELSDTLQSLSIDKSTGDMYFD